MFIRSSADYNKVVMGN